MDLKSPIFEKKICQRLGVFRSLVAWEETGGYNNSCCDATSSQGGLVLSLHRILLLFLYDSNSLQSNWTLSLHKIHFPLFSYLFFLFFPCWDATYSHGGSIVSLHKIVFLVFFFFRFSLYGATSSKGDIIRGDIQSFWETWGSIALKKSSFRKL